MFEDKRFKNNDDNSNNFFMPDNSTGLKDDIDNLNFKEQSIVYTQVKEKKKIKLTKKNF